MAGESAGTLDYRSGLRLERQISKSRLWHRRHVKLVDGTDRDPMPDTKANQDAYPQQPQQKKGLGFPIARMAPLSWRPACSAACRWDRTKGKETGEMPPFRPLLRQLESGDIVLADRYGVHMGQGEICGNGLGSIGKYHVQSPNNPSPFPSPPERRSENHAFVICWHQ